MDYAILKGTVEEGKLQGHYQIKIRAADQLWRAAFNVRSMVQPFAVRYCIDNNATGKHISAMAELREGLSRPGQDGASPDLALDFVRGAVLNEEDLRLIEFGAVDANRYLEKQLDHHVQLAREEEGAFIVVFGVPWLNPGEADPYFGFEPGRGIHDIHMNQGNSGSNKGHFFRDDDGVGQDGAIFFWLPESGVWVGFFVAFQSQSFDTDDATGHRKDGVR